MFEYIELKVIQFSCHECGFKTEPQFLPLTEFLDGGFSKHCNLINKNMHNGWNLIEGEYGNSSPKLFCPDCCLKKDIVCEFLCKKDYFYNYPTIHNNQRMVTIHEEHLAVFNAPKERAVRSIEPLTISYNSQKYKNAGAIPLRDVDELIKNYYLLQNFK